MLRWIKNFIENCNKVQKELHEAGIQIHYHHNGVYVHQNQINTKDDRLRTIQKKDKRTKG